MRAPPPDLFGHVDALQAERNTRFGTFFTPPALARSIVDHALKQIEGLSDRPSLTICDPACGSGAFLHEALRGLRRAGQRRFEDYRKGHFVHGHRDGKVNNSNGLARLGAGWKSYAQARCRGTPPATKFPTADLFVINPPFISVITKPARKSELRSVIGDKAASRGDYSMAFVTKALDSLTDGGAMGTLFPANLLNS